MDKIPVNGADTKLEGYDIFQWAAFARKKSKIASSVCRELGSLKASPAVSSHAKDCYADPLCRWDPWAGASFKLGASSCKHGDDAAVLPEQHVEKAPLWQKYFSRPSEQDTHETEVLTVQSAERAPLWQKVFVKPSEQEVPPGHGVEQSPLLPTTFVKPSELKETNDPWLFLDRVEAGRMSTTCRHWHQLIGDWTPAGVAARAARRQSKSKETANPKLLVVRWHGSLCMDDLIDYFGAFGNCEEMDWYFEENGLNVVPVLFESAAAVHAARQAQPHMIANALRQSIEVLVE